MEKLELIAAEIARVSWINVDLSFSLKAATHAPDTQGWEDLFQLLHR